MARKKVENIKPFAGWDEADEALREIGELQRVIDEDRAFAAHARVDIPRLIQEVERLRAKLAEKEAQP